MSIYVTYKRQPRSTECETHSEMEVKEMLSIFFMYRFTRTKSKYDGTKMIVCVELTADLSNIGSVFVVKCSKRASSSE